MKVIKAVIELESAELLFENVSIKDIAHELIQLSQPKLEISVTDQQVQKFQAEAKKDYMESKTFNDFDAYAELYTRLKIDAYIRLEHAKQAYNEAVMAYSKQIQELKSK
jgi:hypothetical protein